MNVCYAFQRSEVFNYEEGAVFTAYYNDPLLSEVYLTEVTSKTVESFTLRSDCLV